MRAIAFACVALAALCLGVAFFAYSPGTLHRDLVEAARDEPSLDVIDPGNRSFKDITGRRKVDCRTTAQGEDAATILVFGQSNAGNFGPPDALHVPARGVYNFNFFDGGCYEARDPLLGTDTDRSNVATRLGDLLVQRNVFDRVMLVPIAYGGSAVSFWAPGGRLAARLDAALRQIRLSGLTIDLALWQQGEADANPPMPNPAGYKRDFRAMVETLRRGGIKAPIFVAQSTMCQSMPIEIIRQAQRKLVQPNAGIFAGPDTDVIGAEDRSDGCHFAEAGLNRAANLWFEAIARWKSNVTP
jgi:hypothetical protein